ncbi:MAG: hypothetical protein VX603_03405 [Gemmatimonadota bacterium]|nr:hypothetical protein [Gemmatimonadota bacterium]
MSPTVTAQEVYELCDRVLKEAGVDNKQFTKDREFLLYKVVDDLGGVPRTQVREFWERVVVEDHYQFDRLNSDIYGKPLSNWDAAKQCYDRYRKNAILRQVYIHDAGNGRYDNDIISVFPISDMVIEFHQKRVRMRRAIKKRYKDSWSLIVDPGMRKNPETGRLKRHQKWSTVKGTKRAAEQKLAEIINELSTGGFVEPTNLTFEGWMTPFGTPSIPNGFVVL